MEQELMAELARREISLAHTLLLVPKNNNNAVCAVILINGMQI